MRIVTSKKAITTSFFVDFIDIVLNVVVAVATGSIIMVAEAMQGLADLLTSGLLLVGYHRSRKPANKQYPFGFGSEIYFWTIISACIMFFITSVLSFVFGFDRFISPHEVSNKPLMFATLLVALSTNGYALYLSSKRLKSKNNISLWQSFRQSPLVEIKTTFILDLMGSLSALFGLVALVTFSYSGNFKYDGLGAMAIGLMIAVLAFLLIFELKTFIAGKSTSPDVISKIEELVLHSKNIKSVSDIRTLHQGSDKFLLNLDILVNDSLDAGEIGDVIENLKNQLKDLLPNISYIQIELDN